MSNLDEIQARADAATEGPWRLGGSGIIAVAGVEYITSCVRTDADAEFIAHAREDVPLLMAATRAVERLAKHADETHAELPLPHGPLTKGYDMAIRDVRKAIEGALG